MKLRVSICLFLILIFFTTAANSMNLDNYSLISHYPLSSDANDKTGNNASMNLRNTPFKNGGIYCNGKYSGTSSSSCDASTPAIADFDFSSFAISVSFKIDKKYDIRRPVIVCGSSWRWMFVFVDPDGRVGFGMNDTFSNSSPSSKKCDPGTWYTATVLYDSTTSTAELYLDGTRVHSKVEQIDHNKDNVFTITHGGVGTVFKGTLKDLKFYSSSSGGGANGNDKDGDGYSEQQGDCDDNDATAYPGAIEICDDGIDQDCDGHDETRINAPTPPRGLAANAVSYRKILLRWTDKSTDEEGFKIERKKRGCNSSDPWTQIATVSDNINKYDDVKIDPDTQYSYRVRAYNGFSNSDYSNCGTTVSGVSGTPSAPVNLVVQCASDSRVDLSWDEWSSDVTEFKIYRDLDGVDSWTLLTTAGPTTMSYSDTSASGNQSVTGYCYYVQACNDNGCSPPTYTACIPFKPTNLTAIAGSDKIILNWEDNSVNERGFELYRKTGDCSSSGPWEKIKSAGIGRTTVSDKKELVAGTTYSYKIRAYCRSWGLPYVYGYSDWSNCVSVTAP